MVSPATAWTWAPAAWTANRPAPSAAVAVAERRLDRLSSVHRRYSCVAGSADARTRGAGTRVVRPSASSLDDPGQDSVKRESFTLPGRVSSKRLESARACPALRDTPPRNAKGDALMKGLHSLDSWNDGSSLQRKNQRAGLSREPAMSATTAGPGGSSCGAGDTPAPPEPKPSACSSSCGAGDKPKQPEPKPSACSSSCGAGDKPKQPEPKPSACSSSCGAGDSPEEVAATGPCILPAAHGTAGRAPGRAGSSHEASALSSSGTSRSNVTSGAGTATSSPPRGPVPC